MPKREVSTFHGRNDIVEYFAHGDDANSSPDATESPTLIERRKNCDRKMLGKRTNNSITEGEGPLASACGRYRASIGNYNWWTRAYVGGTRGKLRRNHGRHGWYCACIA